MIFSILEENDHRRVKELLPLQRAHENAHNKCVEAITDFCEALDDGSPKFLDYDNQLKTLQKDYFEMRDRIDQFLVNMVDAASSIRASRASTSTNGSKSKKRGGSAHSAATGTRSGATNLSGNRQLDVKLKQLHLGQVKKDLQLKERAAQVESERVLLQAEVELAEAQLLAEAEIEEDCRSQCLSRMDEQAMTSNERVKRFLNENSPVNNLRKELQGVETEVPVQDNLKREEAGTDKLTKETMLSKGGLRADAPEWQGPGLQGCSRDNQHLAGGSAEKPDLVSRSFPVELPNDFHYGSASQCGVQRSNHGMINNDYRTNGSASHIEGQLSQNGATHRGQPGVDFKVADGLAQLFVRCREPVNAVMEDRFDGDPARYQRFIHQFQDTVLNHFGKSDPAHALSRLAAATTGRARKIVEACQVDQSPARALKQALEDLKEAFGAPQLQVDAHLRSLRDGPPVKPTADSLQDIYVNLLSCRNLLRAVGVEEELDAPATTEGIFTRLPKELQRRFVRFAVDRGYQIRRIPFHEVLSFIKGCRDEANSNFGRLLESVNGNNRAERDRVYQKNKTKFGRANSFSADTVKAGVKPGGTYASRQVKCPCCELSENHGLWKCPKFLAMKVPERRVVAKRGKHCFSCLKVGHLAKECVAGFSCKECGLPHNRLLHIEKEVLPKVGDVTPETVKGTASVASRLETGTTKRVVPSRPRIRLKVLPVHVRNPETGSAREVLAFLDGGADCHIIRKELYEELGLKGQAVLSKIGLANGTMSVENTFITDLLVSGIGGSAATGAYHLKSVVVKGALADVSDSAPCLEDLERNPHFTDVEIPIIERDSIDLIIGMNARVLHEIHEKREAGPDQLCAGKSVLGWFIYGSDCTVDTAGDGSKHACFLTSQRVGSHIGLGNEPGILLHKEDACLVCLGSGDCQDCAGTGSRCSKPDPDHREPSLNDDRAQNILDNTCTLVDGHYQIGLLWASEDSKVPDNYDMAKERLNSLGKRLRSKPDLREKYREKVQGMLDEGHVIEIPDRSVGAVPGRTFYIPHHNVANSSKFRVVMDCAAAYQGVSLNSVLLQGPDNFNSLLGVLLRFRLYPVAVVADIKSMFFQVKCQPQDRSALRFLYWENGDPDQEVKIYQSTVHCFGLTCSPCVASYALTRTATDNETDFSEAAVQNVKSNFYVDDWLTSVRNVQEAVELTKEVDQLLTRGGFQLMKFSSNKPEVLEGISSERLAPHIADVELHGGDVIEQKSLGLMWSPREDVLRVKISEGSYAWTRRGFLSFESRIFDPLGIIDPYKLPAKLILRELSEKGFGWDDANLPQELKERWHRWVKHLGRLEDVSLPRCHFNLHKAKIVELHGFADASKVGYGITYYLRVHDGENVHVSYIIGKSKVLPAICTTIPRAELHAALELIEFSRTVMREHNLQLDRTIFWTDSQTVLGYLKNRNKRLPVFECNRVRKILASCSPDQWRWVDTSQNPADAFSRGVSPSKPSAAKDWLQGPTFLLKEEKEWPAPCRDYNCCFATSIIPPQLEGVVRANTASEAAVISDNLHKNDEILDVKFVSELFFHFSVLSRLLKAVSWWHRLIIFLRNRVYRRWGKEETPENSGPISVFEYTESLLTVINVAQRESFPGAFEALEMGGCHEITAGKHGARTKGALTPLQKYCPFWHENVMRIGGRLQKSNFSFDIKHPIVLPKRHHVTMLIVLDAHVKCGHFASNFVLNELLSKYHLVGGKATVKYYLKACMECRNRNASPGTQQMGSLPTGRVTVRRFPFEHCGIDYMCGLKVKQGRNELKRYACIFTCLSTRCTHLEIVNDLSTEAFLMAYRRFLAHTGSVTKVLYSDNGTNFRGASSELKRGLERLNKKRVTGELAIIGVEFRFNPPLASHQGGIFESIIRLVRKVMTCLMDDKKLRTLTDEGLRTLFCEIQMILNRRPLTRASPDPNDLKALCPQNILTGAVDDAFPPDIFTSSDGLRASYRLSQAYVEEFWRRFIAEYVPTLNKREKWLSPQRNLKVGDLVLLHGEPGPRYQFAKAVVTDVHPDKFGHVRRVTVRSSDGSLLEREIAKICLLEADACSSLAAQNEND